VLPVSRNANLDDPAVQDDIDIAHDVARALDNRRPANRREVARRLRERLRGRRKARSVRILPSRRDIAKGQLFAERSPKPDRQETAEFMSLEVAINRDHRKYETTVRPARIATGMGVWPWTFCSYRAIKSEVDLDG